MFDALYILHYISDTKENAMNFKVSSDAQALCKLKRYPLLHAEALDDYYCTGLRGEWRALQQSQRVCRQDFSSRLLVYKLKRHIEDELLIINVQCLIFTKGS